MVKLLISFALEVLVGLFLLTQVIAPIFVKDLKLFWLFQKEKWNKQDCIDENLIHEDPLEEDSSDRPDGVY